MERDWNGVLVLTLDWTRRGKVVPVLGREIVERQQRVTVGGGCYMTPQKRLPAPLHPSTRMWNSASAISRLKSAAHRLGR